MTLPVRPPVAPMLAKLTRELPRGDDLYYEPKWDGFRCIVFRDGEDVELGSRNEKPLTRYFPELVAALARELPQRCVVDGEIVIAGPSGLDFDALSQRIHPAESRVRQLAESTPASFVAFDLLAHDDTSLLDTPYATRRGHLEKLLTKVRAPVHVTPVTRDPDVAADWFDRFEGAGLDGVVAKEAGLAYLPDKRAMLKVKHQRTADCVVAGFRIHKDGAGVGSLLLGLYDGDGTLHHVGVASGFSVARRRELTEEVAPYRKDARKDHPWAGWAEAQAEGRAPGAMNRWNAGKDMTWEPLRPDAVCEVSYDHLQHDRFRHATSFVRWRPDRDPASCTYAQLDTPVPVELSTVFGTELSATGTTRGTRGAAKPGAKAAGRAARAPKKRAAD
ncbi:MAG TPA: ATP-dependent DNA ligase [Acidimicrobiales bacterium]|nr:ATP-dependent DNA ligase [Acidimicrobiales bacterium]